MITLADFTDDSSIRHAFFTRRGGVSKGLYAGLNCGPGSQDKAEDVARNRALAAGKLGVPPQALLTLRQEHTPHVLRVDKEWTEGEVPVADGMVTDRPGLMLGILTADCAPVLFASPRHGVIGAAHAGWKGALGGVLEATVEAMETLGAGRGTIRAAVGPCIAQASYEVGSEFRTTFLNGDEASERFFASSARPDHFMFDLAGYVKARLVRAGVAMVACTDRDTFSDETSFFSYRRTTKRAENDYGRQLSALVLCD